MVKSDVLIFIDANQYLKLYQMTNENGKEILNLLIELQDYIFITAQVVEEVQRSKLKVVAHRLTERVKQLGEWPRLSKYLIDASGGAIDSLLKKFKDFAQADEQTLKLIQQSEDVLSKKLSVLFEKGTKLKYEREELCRARDRRERGNPPGKSEDPLGDQLTWEQLLGHFRGKSKLWVITEDVDYIVKHDGKPLLHAFLCQDLAQVSRKPLDVFCFTDPLTGLKDFVKSMELKAKSVPSEKKSEEIRKELDALPPPSSAMDWQSITNFSGFRRMIPTIPNNPTPYTLSIDQGKIWNFVAENQSTEAPSLTEVILTAPPSGAQ